MTCREAMSPPPTKTLLRLPHHRHLRASPVRSLAPQQRFQAAKVKTSARQATVVAMEAATAQG